MRITLTSPTVQEPIFGQRRVMTRSRIMLLMGASALIAAAGFEAGHDAAALPNLATPASAVQTTQPSPDGVEVAAPALRNMDLHLATVNLQPLVRKHDGNRRLQRPAHGPAKRPGAREDPVNRSCCR
jgi:hypothetical protein